MLTRVYTSIIQPKVLSKALRRADVLLVRYALTINELLVWFRMKWYKL